MTITATPTHRRPGTLRAVVCYGAFTALAALTAVGSATAGEPATTGGAAVIRRLSPDQYRQIITDVFGSTIKIGGRFEPDARTDGLLAVGSSQVSITATGLEQYDAIARSAAEQIVDEQHRATLISCKPAAMADADDACASQFLGEVGRLLYRRPLTQPELQAWVSVANVAAKAKKSFYAGLGRSLADILVSPQFLFRGEVAEPDPDHPGQYRMDAFSKASQLSFFLWNTAPDDLLLTAAEKGELSTEKGLSRQVDRLLASPRLEAGVRAFFTDLFHFDEFEDLSKDAAIYPKYTRNLGHDAQEQTLRTISDLLLLHGGDYRDLFTTRKTFLTPLLGALYGVPVAKVTPNGVPDLWQPYEYPEGDPRAGILSQASFAALHSHPGRSSPTLRGKALREIVLCQKVPDPPANVNFTVVQDVNNPQYKTARARVTAHRTDPVCAGCHKIMDPAGLALETFDSSGGYRTTEHGTPIDTSGELDGMPFANTLGLTKAVHDHPDTPKCLTTRLYSYGVGRIATTGEGEWMKSLIKGFATDGYKLPDLLRRVAVSDAFYRVSVPQTGAADSPMPALASRTRSQLEVQK